MRNAVRIVPVLVVAAVCIALVPSLIWRPFRCNAELTDLLRSTSAAIQLPGGYERTARARQNVGTARRLAEHCPRAIDVYTALGANEQLLGNPEEALLAYQKALSLSHRPELSMEAGNLLVELGRIDEAIETFIPAARFDRFFLNSITDPEMLRLVQVRLGERPAE